MENKWNHVLQEMEPQEQYAYFVGQVAENEVLWGLYHETQDGWAMTRTSDDKQLLVLWPDPELAARNTTGIWEHHRVEGLDLHGFLDHGIDELIAEGRGISLLNYSDQGGLVVELEDLKRDLTQTLAAFAEEEEEEEEESLD